MICRSTLTWSVDVEVLHADFLKLSSNDPSYSEVMQNWMVLGYFSWLQLILERYQRKPRLFIDECHLKLGY